MGMYVIMLVLLNKIMKKAWGIDHKRLIWGYVLISALFGLILIGSPKSVVSAFLVDSVKFNSVELEKLAYKPLDVQHCGLSFYSYKNNKTVNPPAHFVDNISRFSCEDKKLLTKIAHYESEFGKFLVNEQNTYATGFYHVLPTTRIECSSKYGINDEAECALFVIKKFPKWYLIGYRTLGWDKSF